MLKKGLFIITTIFFLFPQYLFAISSSTGTTGASFLKIGTGARPVGMGEAYVAVADDINSAYWNPAGLGTLSKFEVTAMHSIWFSDISYDYLAFAYPSEIGTFGINTTLVSMGTFEGYTINSQGEPVSSGSYTGRDLSIGLIYGYGFDKNIYVGGTLKFINETISDMSAIGIAGDAGFLWKDGLLDGFSIGCNVQNIGFMKYKNVSNSTPLNFKAGISIKPDETSIIAIDADIPTDNKPKINAGLELWMFPEMAVRAGYFYRFGDFDYSTRLVGLTIGAGFNISDYVFLDYAFVPYGNLGLTHRFSLTVKL